MFTFASRNQNRKLTNDVYFSVKKRTLFEKLDCGHVFGFKAYCVHQCIEENKVANTFVNQIGCSATDLSGKVLANDLKFNCSCKAENNDGEEQ